MQLLDAVLAFALTLAALATVVTILMEVAHRLLRMRKKNLIDMMKLLNRELVERFGEGPLKLTAEQRWAFITGVVKNPASGIVMPALEEFGGKTVEEVLDGLRRGKLPAVDDPKKATGDVRDGVYDKVTLEHVLRRLADLEPVAAQIDKIDDWSQEQGKKITAELDRFARKYEEFGSAVSAKFKRRAQFWSFLVGVALAVVANIDGYRIFSAYLADPELAAQVIAQQETFEQRAQATDERAQQREAAQEELDKAQAAYSAAIDLPAGNARTEKLEKLGGDLRQKEEALAKLVGVEQAMQEADRAKAALAELAAAGVPIGASYFPHCAFVEQSQDTATCGMRPANMAVAWTAWVFSAVITGILMGLGAPFWFDVAKRLAQVRQAFRGDGSGEVRMSGQDGDGTAENRETIVSAVVGSPTR